MTGVELEKYLMSSNIFKDENVYMVETIDAISSKLKTLRRSEKLNNILEL